MAPLSSFSIGCTAIDAGHRIRLKLDDDALYLESANRLAVGCRYTMTIEEEKTVGTKTWPQVKYWKGHVCPLIGEHLGYTDKQADLVLLGEKFGYVEGPNGHQIPNVTSITDLTVEEMTELIEWALDWVPATLEIILLPPDKNWKLTQREIRKGRRGHAA